MAVRLLYSHHLVAAQGALTRAAVDAKPQDPPLYQAFTDKPEGGNAGIDSYLKRLGRRLGALGLEYEEVRYDNPRQAVARMEAAAGRRGAAIVMTPNNDLPLLLDVLSTMPARDGDAMTAEGLRQRWPSTPRSIRGIGEAAVGDLRAVDPDRIAVVGANGDVNSMVLKWLKQDGVEPGIIIDRGNSDQEVPNLHCNADLVISATGAPGLLTAGDLLRRRSDGRQARPMTVIDAGVGYNKRTHTTYGDVDPHLYSYNGPQEIAISPAPVIFPDGHASPKGGGVGSYTVEQFIAAGVMDVAAPLDSAPIVA